MDKQPCEERSPLSYRICSTQLGTKSSSSSVAENLGGGGGGGGGGTSQEGELSPPDNPLVGISIAKISIVPFNLRGSVPSSPAPLKICQYSVFLLLSVNCPSDQIILNNI